MEHRSIVHMDLDSFFVSVERLQNSALEGKPVIIGNSTGRGVVSSCSYEARAFGVHSAMPGTMVKRLCPDAIFIRGNMEQYSKYSRLVKDVVAANAPLFEQSSIDEFYLDITGMDRFFGCYQWSSELRERILRETGLPISFGLSTSKTVAKLGTNEAKPAGQMYIPAGDEKQFMAPLPVRKMPMVGKKAAELLTNMGLHTIGMVQKTPMAVLTSVMGKSGKALWLKAQGKCIAPVIPFSERKSISAERTFQHDTLDRQQLRGCLMEIVEKVSFRLRKENKLTGNVSIKIRYSDFNTYTKQLVIPYTNKDQDLMPVVMALFYQLFNKQLSIRLIGVRLGHLISGGYQTSLFEEQSEGLKLNEAMDQIRLKFGSSAVKRAATVWKTKDKE